MKHVFRDMILHSWVQGLAIWPIVAIISLFTLVLATFISHTIAAVLLVPIAAEIGSALDEPHPRLLVMVTSLLCGRLSMAAADGTLATAVCCFGLFCGNGSARQRLSKVTPLLRCTMLFVESFFLTLACSQAASGVEDDLGVRYMDVTDFLKNGVCIRSVATAVCPREAFCLTRVSIRYLRVA
jgi:hypothetical protein